LAFTNNPLYGLNFVLVAIVQKSQGKKTKKDTTSKVGANVLKLKNI